jgi:hypothetical protein
MAGRHTEAPGEPLVSTPPLDATPPLVITPPLDATPPLVSTPPPRGASTAGWLGLGYRVGVWGVAVGVAAAACPRLSATV